MTPNANSNYTMHNQDSLNFKQTIYIFFVVDPIQNLVMIDDIIYTSRHQVDIRCYINKSFTKNMLDYPVKKLYATKKIRFLSLMNQIFYSNQNYQTFI